MSQTSAFSTEAKAGALALLVHGAILLLLVFGVSWQTEHPAPVMVDLWQALPEPTPEPRVKPRLTPPKPLVKETPPVESPDIALEKKKLDEKRAEKIKQAERDEKNALDKIAREEAEKLKTKREAHRKNEDQEMQQRMMEEDLASESRQVKQLAARASASRRAGEKASIVAQFQDQIRAKVRSNTRLPENLKGNPQVKFQVKLLPTGEVLNVQLVQGSGNPAYDDAVERAIYKSSSLPLPEDKDARAAFVPAVILSHRPRD
jgi:colicin import membrane protein